MVFRIDKGAALAKPKRLDDGRLVVEARLTRSGVFEYRNADGSSRLEYRPDALVSESMPSFALVPVTNDHPPEMITAQNARQFTVGQVGQDVRRDGIHVIATLAINDASTIAMIERGKTDVSCGYACDLDETPGVSPDGQRYDAVQRNVRGNHLAIVERGRAGSAKINMDAALRFDAAVQVSRDPSWDVTSITVCAWTMTSADLLARVTAALAAHDGITVSTTTRGDRADAGDGTNAGDEKQPLPFVVAGPAGSNVICVGPATPVYVTVSSSELTPAALTQTLSEALAKSPDLTVRNDHVSPEESPVDELQKALAALAEQTKRADAAEQKLAAAADANKAIEMKLVAAESATVEQTKRADAADAKAASEAKARKDAEDGVEAKISARVALRADASEALGRNDAGEVLGTDGKPVDLSKLTEREVRCLVVQKLDGITVDPARSDDAVAYAFERATARGKSSRTAMSNVRGAIATGRNTADTSSDPEAAARARMNQRRADAHKTPSADAMTKERK